MGLKCVGRFGCGSERARPGFWRNSVGVVGIFAAGDPGWLVPRDPGLEGAAPLGLVESVQRTLPRVSRRCSVDERAFVSIGEIQEDNAVAAFGVQAKIIG